MFVIDFKKTPRQAFLHGFVKGLAAPVMLYHSEPAPGLPLPMYISLPAVPSEKALAGDWLRIGNDIQNAINKHEHQATRG
jgi:hypothetical protein